GQPADMGSLSKIARAHGLAIVEDAAQALGASWQGRPVGSWGDITCLSFFPTKNLGALGDAGMALTNKTTIATRLRRLRDHGSTVKYRHAELGYNSRLDEIQAAALRVKFPHLAKWNKRRQFLAKTYQQGLQHCPLQTPAVRAGAVHVYHQYVIRTGQREALRQYLSGCRIGTALHYPIPLHRQPLFAGLPSARNAFPESEKASREILCLPIAPECTDREVALVIKAIQAFFLRRPGGRKSLLKGR
ncbi:DegT/DnrJ/EryC1/StrS family aminotransferase, partial [candidate division FCPU426 bacterium]|nr:DegT/DnrJ/EryC1/StrS family aminotransferase [candidate division FCPU426 bacterium]